MTRSREHLYDLLPSIYRQLDVQNGESLRALLHVISEQADALESNIDQLWDNWFIETCEGWVVPYIGDLIGYEYLSAQDQHNGSEQFDRLLIPRCEVANTIRYRRRKGTLALLELLAKDVSGWPARIVEFGRLVSTTQSVKHINLTRGKTVDVGAGRALDLLNTPFDLHAKTVDIRCQTAEAQTGRYNLPHVALFVWRLKPYSVTRTPAYCVEEVGNQCYTFSVLGNDTELYTSPERETTPTQIAGELHVPITIRPRAFMNPQSNIASESDQANPDYYGLDKSLAIWTKREETDSYHLIPATHITPADLSRWAYRPLTDHVAVDVKRGRMVFPPNEVPAAVMASFHYGFSGDVGGGEYEREIIEISALSSTVSPITKKITPSLYRIGPNEELKTIKAALNQWSLERPLHGVIEVTESGLFEEELTIQLLEDQGLTIRAANHVRPVIRVVDSKANRPDALKVRGAQGSSFALDGVLVSGRGIEIKGKLSAVTFRHSTLVPGWMIRAIADGIDADEPSLEIDATIAHLLIERSIVGHISIIDDPGVLSPLQIKIIGSIVDANSHSKFALSSADYGSAHASIFIKNSTVLGGLNVHELELAENSIFTGVIRADRRQKGCMRFCYIPPGSRTPSRYYCQPDHGSGLQSGDEKEATEMRIRPEFTSVLYGSPAYCQLSHSCAEEILKGADDESEMGVFHSLYQPQRSFNLRSRLEEFTPVGTYVSIIYAN